MVREKSETEREREKLGKVKHVRKDKTTSEARATRWIEG